MTEFKNPFLEENFVTGQSVTVLSSKTELEPVLNGAGEPVQIDGVDWIKNVWAITYLKEDETEKRASYSMGGLIPTVDGKGFTKSDGTPGYFGPSSEAGKLSKFMGDGGFDFGTLFNTTTGEIDVSKLVGAVFTLKYVDNVDKSGKVKTYVSKQDGKTYNSTKAYLSTFQGMKEGVGGNGAAAPVDEETVEKARALVLELLNTNDGKLTRADLIRQLNAQNADKAIVLLATKESFHNGAPWTRESNGSLSL